jgi:hypothetical protein
MSNSDKEIDDVLNGNYYTSHSKYNLDKPLNDLDIDIDQILNNDYGIYKANLKIAKEIHLEELDEEKIHTMTDDILNYEYVDKKENTSDYDKLKSAYMSKVSQFNSLKESYVLTINNFMKLKHMKDFTEKKIIPILQNLEAKTDIEVVNELRGVIEERDTKLKLLFTEIVNASELDGNYKFKILTKILESL